MFPAWWLARVRSSTARRRRCTSSLGREFHRWPDVQTRTSRRSATGGSFPTRRVAVRSPRSARRRRPAATCVKFSRQGCVGGPSSSKTSRPDAVEHVDGYRRSRADRKKICPVWFRAGSLASAWASKLFPAEAIAAGIGIRSPANAAKGAVDRRQIPEITETN